MPYLHKSRSYLHFDQPLSRQAAESLVTNPTRVATHSFYPFISYSIETKKIFKERGSLGEREVVKKPPKARPIKIASHADAAIFSYYAQSLAPRCEALLTADGTSGCVAAFRSGRGTNIDTTAEIFHFTSDPHYVLTFDIEGFFDNLDHGLLQTAWQEVLETDRLPADHYAVFRALTRYAEVNRAELYGLLGISVHNPKQTHLEPAQRRIRACSPETFRGLRAQNPNLIRRNMQGKGIPQGSPISAFLSNVYMRSFDKIVHDRVIAEGGCYRRYCDDIAIVLPQSSNFGELEGFLSDEVQKLRLTINTEKTKRAAFPATGEEGITAKVQYLGFTKDQQKILIREGSLSRYYGRMRRAVCLAKRSRLKHNRLTGQNSPLRTAKIYRQYSYLIRRKSRAKQFCQHDHVGNFITYAYKAAEKLGAPEIKQQMKGHWPKLQAEIRKQM